MIHMINPHRYSRHISYIPWIEVAIADEEGKELGMSRAAGQQGTSVLFLWAKNVLGEKNEQQALPELWCCARPWC